MRWALKKDVRKWSGDPRWKDRHGRGRGKKRTVPGSKQTGADWLWPHWPHRKWERWSVGPEKHPAGLWPLKEALRK